MVNDGKKVAANRVITNTLCCTYFKIVLYGEVEVPHTHQLCICYSATNLSRKHIALGYAVEILAMETAFCGALFVVSEQRFLIAKKQK